LRTLQFLARARHSPFHAEEIMPASTARQATEAASDAKYQKRVQEALDSAEERVAKLPAQRLDAARDRWVIFSDQHKGIRDRADDFRRNEQAYNAALAYYNRLGYTLVVLGDVEELWKERPGPVLESYQRTLELEASFHAEGRYLRVWGNHDDAWRNSTTVRRFLYDIFGAGLKVEEGAYLDVYSEDVPLGRILLLHGHQGTAGSDRFGWFSRFVVRWIWRPFQRLTEISLNSPAKDFSLRHAHSVAMYRWAAAREKLVLVAGHTHQPVFKSKSLEQQVLEEVEASLRALAEEPEDETRVREAAELEARLEWVRAEGRGRKGAARLTPMERPCYFNTGCCCFTDGDVTGLEIADGMFRLIRWPDDQGKPHVKELARESVESVFAALEWETAGAPYDGESGGLSAPLA
jgi:UDP-2,3-diacylglucosamine pyrophosphatase LpxH